MKHSKEFCLLAALFLSGCSYLQNITSTDESCEITSWMQQGIEDGSNGYLVTQFDDRVAACATHKVVPNIAAYAKGHKQGIKKYCTQSSGFQAALKKDFVYNGVCTKETAVGFITGMNQAQKLALLKEKVKQSKSTIQQQEITVQNLKKLIANSEQNSSSSTTDRQVAKLKQELKETEEGKKSQKKKLSANIKNYQSMLKELSKNV